MHRDLKSHNLLVDNNWNVKVADFGLSRTQSLTMMTAAGTPQWSAPEVIRQDYYTEKADVFSFGVIIFELLSKEIPYINMGPLSAAHQVAYEGLRFDFSFYLFSIYLSIYLLMGMKHFHNWCLNLGLLIYRVVVNRLKFPKGSDPAYVQLAEDV